MKSMLLFLLVAGAVLAAGVKSLPVYGRTDEESVNTAITVPVGYRDWQVISVAHEEGDLNDIRAILGNEVAIGAYRNDKRPFPDGTIIARVAWGYEASDENNRAFGRRQSFVAGAPTNVQFIVKDSKKYASTGGWGFAQFTGGKRGNEAVTTTCFSCHQMASTRDFVFTNYAP